MTTTTGKTTDDERGLLPYPVIIAATKGEPQAMNIVVQHLTEAFKGGDAILTAGNEYCRATLRRLYRTPFYEKAP